MTHEETQQLAALNAIGAASPEEVAELRRHYELCEECRQAGDELDETAALLALNVDPVPPPAAVRAALLRKIERTDRIATLERPVPRTAGTWLKVAAVALIAMLAATSVQLRTARREAKRLAEENARIAADRQKLSETIAALSGAGTRTIRLAGQPVAPNASARVFLDPAQRRAFVFFDDLPPNPGDKSYQLWIIRADQVAPQSAGVFNVGGDGRASLVVQNLPVDTIIKALAVTLEPKGGVSSPTGEKYLLGM